MVNDAENDSLPMVVDSSASERELPDPYAFDFHDGATKLEPEHMDLTRRILAAGGSKHMLADMCGIAYRTLRDWVRKGERNLESDDELNRWGAFVQHYRAGLVEFEAEQVSRVKNPEWLLERRLPERWGKKTQADVNISQVSQYEPAEPSKDQKDFLQRLAGGGMSPDERETIDAAGVASPDDATESDPEPEEGE